MSKLNKVKYFIETVREVELPASPQPLTGKQKSDRNTYMREELAEFWEADTLADQVDAMVDLHYFMLGAIAEMGLTDEQYNECFAAVHSANLTKKAGAKPGRTTWGKDAFKPEGFVDPKTKIKEILDC